MHMVHIMQLYKFV